MPPFVSIITLFFLILHLWSCRITLVLVLVWLQYRVNIRTLNTEHFKIKTYRSVDVRLLHKICLFQYICWCDLERLRIQIDISVPVEMTDLRKKQKVLQNPVELNSMQFTIEISEKRSLTFFHQIYSLQAFEDNWSGENKISRTEPAISCFRMPLHQHEEHDTFVNIQYPCNVKRKERERLR